MGALELDFGSEFLNHSTRASGSGFLANWKEDGRIVVWMHRRSPIYSLWSHSWSRYATVKDKETKKESRVIRGMRVNCLESEKLLKKQKWRNDNDTREMPPTICPHCLTVEWVRAQINAGALEWSTPIFRFEVADEEHVIYAGGFCGLFQKKELSKAELSEVRKTGIKLNEAFMQNGFCRQQYIFTVASDADPDAGWVIAMEGQTLGDKLKKTIHDEIKRCDGDLSIGHPMNNPYPFEWTYDENKDFSDKYDVVALSRKRPSDKIQALLDQDEYPDFTRLIANPHLGTLKQSMKEAALIDFPFDDLFAKAIDEYGEQFDEEDAEVIAEEPPVKKAASVELPKKPAAKQSAQTTEMVGCDVCESPMRDDELVCGSCGAKYAANEEGDLFLASRACGNPDCMEKDVPVNEDGGGKCPQCGAVHNDSWEYKLPEVAKAMRRATRQGAVVKQQPEPEESDDARPSRRSKARAALSG
jgi:hypothetical protein